VFVIWELTEEHPIVDLRIFRHRGFTLAVVTLAATFGSYFASIVVIPQWLQSSQGYTAFDAGMVTAFTALTSLVTAFTLPRWIDKVDLRIPITLGIAWFLGQTLVRSTWSTGMDFWSLAMPQIIQGFGISMFMMPLTQMSLSSVEPHEVPGAAGLQNFLRTMSIAVATSLILTDWGNQQRVAQNEMANILQPDATMATLNQAGFSDEAGRQIISNLVTEQAVTVAMNHTSLMAAIVTFATIGLVWLGPRPKSLGVQGGGH